MPWLAIPFGDPRIEYYKKQFNITSIPKLIVLK
jgi:hypothetical protein